MRAGFLNAPPCFASGFGINFHFSNNMFSLQMQYAMFPCSSQSKPESVVHTSMFACAHSYTCQMLVLLSSEVNPKPDAL